MIVAAALLLATQAVQTLPDTPPVESWASLPVLRLPFASNDPAIAHGFVSQEVAAGRCSASVAADGSSVLHVDAIVRRLPDGRVDAIRPQAIGCPTVEQYAVGVIQRLVGRATPAIRLTVPMWYRVGLTFAWTPPPPVPLPKPQ